MSEIPDKLETRDQWVCWQYQCRNCWNTYDEKRNECPECGEDVSKVPIDPNTGNLAKSNDTSTWASLSNAREYHQSNPETQGLGFMFDADGLLAGVDLDNCRDPDSGAVDAWAQDVVERLDSFTEVSPSGTGLHIYILGFVPDGGNRAGVKDGEIEMYDQTRYFTVTGNQVNLTPGCINQRNDALREIHAEYIADDIDSTNNAETQAVELNLDDETIIKKATNAENSEKFQSLWRGDTTGYESHSEARMALLTSLAFWTNGDDRQMERLFTDSGMYPHPDKPGKLDRVLDDEISKAIQQQTEYYDPDAHTTVARETEGVYNDTEPNWDSVRSLYDSTNGEGRLAAANALEKSAHWMYVMDSERLWVYDNQTGFYSPRGKERARHILENELGRRYKRQEANEIIDRLEARNQTQRSELNARNREHPLLCVGNGVVNLETGELTDHSPKYKFTRGLNWDYDPENANPEPILNFLDDVTKRIEDRDTLLDHLAHGLMPGHPYRAFVMMYGPGSNGKTKTGELFRRFVGEDNAAAVELQDLTGDDRFATGALPGAYINIGDDVSVGELRDTSILKSLTGGGTMRANEKFEKKFDFKNEAAMFFSANEPPRFAEKSEAIADRLYPIELPYRFVSTPEGEMERQKETGVIDRLAEDDAIMRGLLVLAVEHAQDLIERDGEYSMDETPTQRRERYESASDPVKRFALQYLHESDGDAYILKDDAYKAYKEMCDRENERVKSKDTFKKAISEMASIDAQSSRPRSLTPGESRDPAWKYVKFAQNARTLLPDRLQRRYFEGDDLTISESESSQYDVDESLNARPVQDVALDPTGYVNVTVDVVKVTHPDGENAPAMRATVKDESSAIDAISWDNADVLPEGETVLIENAEVNEYDGTRQLTIQDGITTVQSVQPGVGFTEGHSTQTGQSSLNTATDGGQFDLSKDKVDSVLRNDYTSGDSISVAEIAGKLTDVSPDDVKDALDHIQHTQDLLEAGVSEPYKRL